MKYLVFAVLFLSAFATSAGARFRFEGTPRACAGGIEDDVHTISLRIQSNVPSDTVSPIQWELSGETGGAFIVSHDANSVRVRSGARPATPTLRALQNNVEVGRVTLDFAPPEFYSRFTAPVGRSRIRAVEDGIMINSETFSPKSYGKIYLKFRRSLAIGDVNGNWAPVAAHRVRIRVMSAQERSVGGKTFAAPDDLVRFGRIFSSDQILPAASPLQCDVTTRADGTATFEIEYFKAANSAAPYDNMRRLNFALSVEDLTVAGNPDYRAPGAPVAQRFSAPPEKVSGAFWFDVPAGLKARVLWNAKTGDEETSVWKWCDLADGARGSEHEFRLRVSDGTLGVKLAPDGSRALILRGRSGQYLDDCHDTMIAELESGRVWGFANYLFGHSETWDFTSRRVATVDGSLDTIFGEPVAAPLALWAREAPLPAPGVSPPQVTIGALRPDDLLPHQNTFFLTDNDLDRDSLAWTPGGELLASSSSGGYGTPPFVLRFSGDGKTKKQWQSYAWSPLAAPDGKHIAYQGYERAADGNWNDVSPALCVSEETGQTRRTLTRLPGLAQSFVWSPDGQFLFNYENGVIASYDVKTGARGEVARLRVEQKYEKSGLLSVSDDGAYLLLHGYRWENQAGDEKPPLWADVLFALRLRDGQLLPIAAFSSDYAVAAK